MKEEMFRIHQMELDEMAEEIYNNRETIKQLQSQIDEVKEWCEKHKEYCFKEKDKDYIDELGAYQLLGSYLTCETIISKLEEVGK